MEPIKIKIDRDLCNGCGLCIPVCPREIMSMADELAVGDSTLCIGCGHCAASCPQKAIDISFIDADGLKFETLNVDKTWLKPGKFDAASLVNLMSSRRSCRKFSDESVERDLLKDLVKAGMTAPSGSNTQQWTFTILPTAQAVEKLGSKISGFFRKLNNLASKRSVRFLSRLFAKDVLGKYYRDYYEFVEQALHDYDVDGKDMLFHQAPAAILVGAKTGSATPCEDALLATQNILLAAHAAGLGTCLIGFAVEAIKNDKGIRKNLGLEKGEKIYAVIVIGKSKEKYQRTAGRRKVEPRYYE